MKTLFLILPTIILLAACSSPVKENEGQITEPERDEAPFNETELLVEESEEAEFETTWTRVAEAYIGDYQDLAIMVLKEEGKDEDGQIKVTGYYFYEKHQKNLDLEGTKNPNTGKYILTESYKGKPSGYMEFIPEKPDQSFWAAKKGGEQQDMNVRIFTGGDPYEMTLVIDHGTYGYEHELVFYNDDEAEPETTTDELKVTFIDDEFMAFTLDVVRTNGHLGGVSGIATIDGKKAKYYVPETDNTMLCDLEFDLSVKNEITVKENDCSSWHGAFASFDGTYVKQ